ncbi:MAG: ATP-binding protein [Bellilinea sp.]|nr:ATP-binding protein [Bellilinea sp.]
MTDTPAEDSSFVPSNIRSLRELIDLVSGRSIKDQIPQEDAGYAEVLPFPFLALVGQKEMKIALCLTLINPEIGGVLLIGPRGTGKTTAVRSLIDLLPPVERSACFYGCLPEDIEAFGMDGVCPDCARKFAEGKPLTIQDRVKLVELPLNAKLEDVIGGIDERAAVHDRLKLKRGILAHADLNILYVDEVNLLADEIVDAILDASASGNYTVRRGPITATYRARFTLIGSMNPEEGNLRPQIMDRFGLRVIVQGLNEPLERLEAYHRTHLYRQNPRKLIALYQAESALAAEEIALAKQILPKVELPEEVARQGIQLIQRMQIDSLRAEITLFESARAYAAADNRTKVTMEDLRQVAPMSLRLRRSRFMTEYFQRRQEEEQDIQKKIEEILGK